MSTMDGEKVSKHTTFNEKSPVISIRCESQAQKEQIDKLAVAASVPRNTFILDRVLGRNTGSNTGSNTTVLNEDLRFLLKEFFAYIAEHGADDIPERLLLKLDEIDRRFTD